LNLESRVGKYYVGFDIGSDSVHTIALDERGRLIHDPRSLMHFGNPTDTLKEAYEGIVGHLGEEKIAAVAFTGSVGELIAKTTDSPFYYDTISIPSGAEIVAPDAEYIFHMGSKDPYFFEREAEGGFVSDHGTGTKCGGGSGILINKQVRRFFIEEHAVKLEEPDSAEELLEKERIRRENRRKLQKQAENIQGIMSNFPVKTGR